MTVKFWLYLRRIFATSSSPEEILAEISKYAAELLYFTK